MGNNLEETAFQYTKRVMGARGKARKSLGQNFLIDDAVIDKIVEESIIDPDIPLVEIGAGPGGMTRILAQRAKKLWAVELDREKAEILSREFRAMPVEVLNMDALKLKLKALWGDKKGWLVGNLPYYITNPLLMHFLEQSDSLLGMTVMVQKEVAERMTAAPGGRDYGILSVAVQLSAEVKKLLEVPPSAFWPQPKVTSSVLKLQIRPYPGFTADRKAFFQVVKAAFAQRRKTLLNSLSANLKIDKQILAQELKTIGISEKRRAETLSILDFQEVTRAVEVIKEKANS